MEKHDLEAKIKQLRMESNTLENQIHEIEAKKFLIDKEISDYLLQIERMQYHGMTRNEYFRAIEGTEFEIGKFNVKIGSPYTNNITVSTYDADEDLRFSVTGGFNSEGGTFDVYRQGNNVKGTKYYSKKYYGIYDIPKKRAELYTTMTGLKTKYGKMMENAEIKIPTKN